MSDFLDAVDAQQLVAEAECAVLEAEIATAHAAMAASDARLASMRRIQAALPALEAVERMYPGRGSVSQLLADAGKTWTDVGLSEQDGALAGEMYAGAYPGTEQLGGG